MLGNDALGKVTFRTGNLTSDETTGDLARASVVMTDNISWSPELETQVNRIFLPPHFWRFMEFVSCVGT